MAKKRSALVHLVWGGAAEVGLNPGGLNADNSFHMDLTGSCSGEFTGRVEVAVDGVCTTIVDGWPHAGRETIDIKIFADDGRTIELGAVEITWDTYAKTAPPYCGWFIWKDRVGQWGAFVTDEGTYFNNMLTLDIPVDPD
ncbi:MAG: hypothetical protein O7B81_12865 [Gammaproteobacteria bacterium]|nr:hypothetical protein [Gammaproteobacteria bacterium]